MAAFFAPMLATVTGCLYLASFRMGRGAVLIVTLFRPFPPVPRFGGQPL